MTPIDYHDERSFAGDPPAWFESNTRKPEWFMGYIDRHLISGEELIHRGRLHKIIFIKPTLVIIAGIAVSCLATLGEGTGGWRPYVGWTGGIIAIVGVLWWLWIWLDYTTSEFGVTNKRVLLKSGLVRRRTVEMFLNKVENIGVEQSVFGRIIGSGCLTVTGSGGTQEHFHDISAPLDFRKQVHEQISKVVKEEGDTGEHD